jgi:hypothetical protein
MQREAALIEAGDMTLTRRLRMPAEARATGLVFSKTDELVGAIDELGIVRDMNGRRLGIAGDPMEDEATRAYASELVARSMLG